MKNQNSRYEIRLWKDRIKRNLKDVLTNALISGFIIFVFSYGSLFIMIRLFPSIFIDYINPIFNSGGERDILFYLHPFVLSLSLSVFWNRFCNIFTGSFYKMGIEFGFIYTFVALVPILWITYSAMDVSLEMIFTWLIYGLFQSCIGGFAFSIRKLNSPH
jgi:hypothetical protein